MTLQGGFWRNWELERLEQDELVLAGLTDTAVGLVTDAGAVVLEAAQPLQRGLRAGRVAVCLQPKAHHRIQDQREEADQCVSPDAIG